MYKRLNLYNLKEGAMKAKILLILVSIMISLVACSSDNNSSPSNDEGESKSGIIEIDWVDFIVLNDINYYRTYMDIYKLKKHKVGEVIGEVEFNVANNIDNPKYEVKNGDAAFLEKGTKIYKLKDYSTNFRVAVYTNNEWILYEADSNPKAQIGEDLLDINNKVTRIGINSETDGKTELATINDKATINELVELVSNAKVNQNNENYNGERYFIKFYLDDDSYVNRCYWIESGELSRGIMLSKEFGNIIKDFLKTRLEN